jgi:hypothetical protein
MSLYLAIFDGDEQITGWVLGHYSDFGCFRDTVTRVAGAMCFPLLMSHSDCDGEWSPADAPGLIDELLAIAGIFRGLPPEEPTGAFEHATERRAGAASLYDCFHNVDGENLFEALVALCRESIRLRRPILFQ